MAPLSPISGPPGALPPTMPQQTVGPREALARYFKRVRAATGGLVAYLDAEDQLVQSMPEASPTKWHLAHTTWLFEHRLLARFAPGYTAFDDRYAFLFGATTGRAGCRLPRRQRGLLSRPPVGEIIRYREHVNAAMLRLIDHGEEREWPEIERLTRLGLGHEQQHQELILTDIKHVFWSNPLLPSYRTAKPHHLMPEPAVRWFDQPGSLAEIGCDASAFCFANETPRHQVHVPPFRLAGRAVTSGEYLEFIDGGGYDNPDLWQPDGWSIAQAEGWRAPLYWQKQGGVWLVFTLTGLRVVDHAEPVCHVSYYEAAAFARWSGKRLPREAEWEIVASGWPTAGDLLGSGRLHPASCTAPPGEMAQLFGGVWEWTQSPHAPYPGFRETPSSDDQHGGRFMATHMVLRGGSCVTPDDHVRATYRNFLPPAARWQFSGIRLAEEM